MATMVAIFDFAVMLSFENKNEVDSADEPGRRAPKLQSQAREVGGMLPEKIFKKY